MCIVYDYSETSSTGSRARVKVDDVLSRLSTSSVVVSLRVLMRMRVGSLEANEPKCKMPMDMRRNGAAPYIRGLLLIRSRCSSLQC